jgi:hypothetical protein
MVTTRLAIGALSMLLLSVGTWAANCPLQLVTIEADGRASEGSKEALRKAFRAGLPLRVGWSLNFDDDPEPEVTHWSDGGFLTEFEGEVFAQLADIQAQGPRLGKASIGMPAKRKRWTGLLGTNGVLEGNFDDGEVTPTTRVRSEWCVDPRAACAYAPETFCGARAEKAEVRDADERDLEVLGRDAAYLTIPGNSLGSYGLETAAAAMSE